MYNIHDKINLVSQFLKNTFVYLLASSNANLL